MKNVFACPHCRATLNPSVKILLVASYRRQKGMILLSPQPGNFKYICDPSVERGIKPGSMVTFLCPVCAADLTSTRNKKFTELVLVVPGGDDRRAEFSREFGTHATFVIDGDEVTSFGDDADDSHETNFFGS